MVALIVGATEKGDLVADNLGNILGLALAVLIRSGFEAAFNEY